VPARVRLVAGAGPDIGRGHLARALSLAEASWRDGIELELELIEGQPGPTDIARADSAGVRLVDGGQRPATGTITVVDVPDPTTIGSGRDPDRLVVFDDSERFEGTAALVVQPSMPSWAGRAAAARVVAGYAWAPIGAAWRDLAGEPGAVRRPDGPDAPRPRVLVGFGGSDPSAVTARLAPAIAADQDWDTTVVVGRDYTGPRPSGADVRRDPDDLPHLIADADLVVLGAGTMKFEVASLGRPALLVGVADDQLAVGPAFAETGAARWLGDGRAVDPVLVHGAVVDLLADGPARDAMSAAARRTIDGAGADRLAELIVSLA
jgi:spore coat polysaccharide biosynthesis predicted glycosyltransferase SpsG